MSSKKNACMPPTWAQKIRRNLDCLPATKQHPKPACRVIGSDVPIRGLNGQCLQPKEPPYHPHSDLSCSFDLSFDASTNGSETYSSESAMSSHITAAGKIPLEDISRIEGDGHQHVHCHLLNSTCSYPLSSTIKTFSESTDIKDLTLMIDEEQVLEREGRKPIDTKRSLRRQSGMLRLPGVHTNHWSPHVKMKQTKAYVISHTTTVLKALETFFYHYPAIASDVTRCNYPALHIYWTDKSICYNIHPNLLLPIILLLRKYTLEANWLTTNRW